ncbi:type II secretion system F family protein [Echinimonas agarilytica]|uniref:Type II secretion system F family protein n=1 Tax=Echinimonas agarilytica TaxID=1215918 RepID=A0AA41W4N1_9GAMM|nr:type II secretion system F family protein [Echinimonas agarilytica]MCM2678584.1 type II secretion system F family protein [Echinimonas agarilytica]
MAKYSYHARDGEGQEVRGEIDAVTPAAAADNLLRRSLIPIKIEEASESGTSFDLSALFESKIGLDELVIFSRQMYSLTKAGVPILGAITGLSEASHSKIMKETLDDLLEQLESGRTLSTAMAGHPKVFTRMYISLVHVGENTGQLDEAFLQLAMYLQKEQETRRRIKSAVRYPTFVIIAITLALVVLNIFVIPKFADMFAKFNAELPWPTRFLIGMSDLFVNQWHWMLIGLVLMVVGARSYVQSEAGRLNWDGWKIRLPIMGSIIYRSTLERFSRSFAIMLRAGVPINQALTLVGGAVDNAWVAVKVAEMRREIERGDTLLRTCRRSELFTPLVLQMIAVGEETGKVDELLLESADFYEREVDFDLKSLTARIEPILILVVAGMVLILALGIFTPMWDMMRVIRGSS